MTKKNKDKQRDLFKDACGQKDAVSDAKMPGGVLSFKEALIGSFNFIQDLYARELGDVTVFPRVVWFINGPPPGTLTLVAGDHGVGKTALALYMMKEAALKSAILYFSLNTSADNLIKRFLFAESKLEFNRINHGYMYTKDWSVLTNAAASLMAVFKDKIFLVDSVSAVEEVIDKIRAMMQSAKIERVFLDDIAAISSNNKERKKAITLLKKAAVELQISITAVTNEFYPDNDFSFACRMAHEYKDFVDMVFVLSNIESDSKKTKGLRKLLIVPPATTCFSIPYGELVLKFNDTTLSFDQIKPSQNLKLIKPTVRYDED